MAPKDKSRVFSLFPKILGGHIKKTRPSGDVEIGRCTPEGPAEQVRNTVTRLCFVSLACSASRPSDGKCTLGRMFNMAEKMSQLKMKFISVRLFIIRLLKKRESSYSDFRT